MITSSTHLGPLDAKRIHPQRIQVPGKRLVERPQTIVQPVHRLYMARQRSRFVREVKHRSGEELQSGRRGMGSRVSFLRTGEVGE
jgi:hypothetical protein